MKRQTDSLVFYMMFGPVVLGFILAGLAVVLVGAPWQHVGFDLAVYIVGFLLFLQAKRSVRKREPFSKLGTKNMTPSNRSLYKIGYGLMLIGVVITYVLYSFAIASASNSGSAG